MGIEKIRRKLSAPAILGDIQGDPGSIGTPELADGALAASAAGRLKMAAAFFDEATVNAKFAAGAIDPDRLKAPRIGVLEQTVAFGEFTDGGAAAGTLVLTGQIPAGAIVLHSKVAVPTGFIGDTSAALTIGDGSDVDRYNAGTPSVFAAAANGIEMGVPSGGRYHPTAQSVTLTVTSGADFTAVSAGQMTVGIYYLVT